MSSLSTTYEGKAKRVSPRADGQVAIQYKDDATAFNGEKHEVFAGKGELNSCITELLFEHLHRQGISTHHLGRIDARTLTARRVAIVPLEVVVRFRVAGSLAQRTGLDEGTPCPEPIIELYYKRDDLGDPLLNDDHVRLLGLATPREVAELRDSALRIANEVQRLFARAQLDLFDLKLEFGRAGGGLLLADEISPDTCRLRDASSGLILDKDRFRRGEGDLLAGYREVLARLRTALAADERESEHGGQA